MRPRRSLTPGDGGGALRHTVWRGPARSPMAENEPWYHDLFQGKANDEARAATGPRHAARRAAMLRCYGADQRQAETNAASTLLRTWNSVERLENPLHLSGR